MGKHETTDLHRARDELFSHIQRCGVLEATPEQREEWLDDTLDYLAERYPSLSRKELGEVKELGERYCQPVIPHGQKDANDAWSEDGQATAAEGDEPEGVEPEAVKATESAPVKSVTE